MKIVYLTGVSIRGISEWHFLTPRILRFVPRTWQAAERGHRETLSGHFRSLSSRVNRQQGIKNGILLKRTLVYWRDISRRSQPVCSRRIARARDAHHDTSPRLLPSQLFLFLFLSPTFLVLNTPDTGSSPAISSSFYSPKSLTDQTRLAQSTLPCSPLSSHLFYATRAPSSDPGHPQQHRVPRSAGLLPTWTLSPRPCALSPPV